jgi:NAD(P)-dependent dehydrogenase (short-subunit alcohol dehydrogenase family)
MTESNHLFDLDGRVAVVTGASSGLGVRFAQVLHGAGATVVLAARRADRLADLAEAIGPRAIAHPCDVTVDAERVELIGRAVERFGTIDVLVNNAGAMNPVAAEDEPVEAFRDILELNLVAPFHLAQLAGRVMLERGRGSIINIASILGLVGGGSIRVPSYAASKGGLVNLTRELGVQWARRGVRVNAIAPGYFESEMTAEMWEDERSIDYIRRNTPTGRQGTPDELDGVLLLLAGGGSSYISGQTIVVDGGWTSR